ncbi:MULTISPECIES: capsule biosynthesis protein [unclassified Avibacterium]|uniref:capsule biosynthesis protein n=1 Tax=unclassified Avibacterium TaxID=2685287 RepID=UPI0020271B70|nr:MULTISPECIES: capsule biosynthesis protein [unclassified Avibacterium]MCW9698305.1 capsule biosynthesis protein [Avibacterium sp. 20-129]URL07450.1 capsule biosynthesis protein [Avibacterium sp. 21-595]
MIEHNLDILLRTSKNILLLQGPIGDFFYQLSLWLSSQNKMVFKINFNGGDEAYYPSSIPNTFDFSYHFTFLSSYLRKFCRENNIDTMVCFGDNRPCHKIAKKISQELNMKFWVFEEGYFRPDYITLEEYGVNAFSKIPKRPDFFIPFSDLPEKSTPVKVSKGFWSIALRAVKYYVSANLAYKKYPDNLHHRIFTLDYYIKLWVISGFKRLYYYLNDYFFAKKVEKGTFGEFFIVPLQVYDDSQVVVHSDYNSVKSFLEEVLVSFAKYSPQKTNLIIKHHPMDRGFIDYGDVIKRYIKDYPVLKGRIWYIHDVPMPVFLRAGKGMITLNSTSGLSALLHNMPVKTLGRANYDFAGLTYQGELNDFWTSDYKPDPALFSTYRKYHLYKTHLNGNFYNKVILRKDYNK